MGHTVALAAENFRRKVFWSSTERVRRVGVLHVELAQAEIAQSNVASVVQQDVLRFEVTVLFGLYDSQRFKTRRTDTPHQAHGDVQEQEAVLRYRTDFAPR